MEIVSLVGLIALVWKVVDVLRLAAGRDKGAVTQLLAWVVGVGAIFLAANSDIGETWDVGAGKPLGLLNGASLVLLGLMYSSAASAAVDVKQAIDGHDSAAKPGLLPDTTRGRRADLDHD